MSKRHPTPWRAHLMRDDPFVTDGRGFVVAEFLSDHGDGNDTLPEALDAALLCAAAPDMLDALERILTLGVAALGAINYEAALAAVKKAKGVT